jgi:hypothetical protein
LREDINEITLENGKAIEATQDQMFFCKINNITRMLSVRNAMTVSHAALAFGTLGKKNTIEWSNLKSIKLTKEVATATCGVSPGMFRCAVIGNDKFLVCESSR